MFDWKASYAIGIDEIDRQHERLLEYYGAIADAEDAATVAGLLTDLGDYLHYHFDTEERLMRERGFDGLADHVTEHRGLIAALEGMSARVLARPDAHHDVAAFLKTWLSHHILVVDRELMALVGG